MKSLFRLRFTSHILNPNPKPFLYVSTIARCLSSSTATRSLNVFPSSSMEKQFKLYRSSSMEKQFKLYRNMLMESNPKMSSSYFRDPEVTLDSAIEMLKYCIYNCKSSIFLHGYCPNPSSSTVVEDFTNSLKHYYDELAQVRKSSPEKYYENYSRWEDQRRKTISIVAFLHWLETGNLIWETEIQRKMKKIHFEPEDYVVGLTMMTSELPGYVVHQALAGDYDAPKKALLLLDDVYTLVKAVNSQDETNNDDKYISGCFNSVKETIRRIGKMSEDVKVLMPKKDAESLDG